MLRHKRRQEASLLALSPFPIHLIHSTNEITMPITITNTFVADPESLVSIYGIPLGTPVVGQTMIAVVLDGYLTTGGNWTRDGVNIAGATTTNYKLVSADIGKAIGYTASGLASVTAVSGKSASAKPVICIAAI